MRRSRTIIALGVLLLLVIGTVVVWQQTRGPATRIAEALDTLPGETQIASFTDWRLARDDLDAGVSSQSSPKEKERFFDAAYTKDYTAVSLLATVEAAMSSSYGWSVLDTEWEMYGQGRRGAVAVLKMPSDFDFAAADAALTDIGYPPADSQGCAREARTW